MEARDLITLVRRRAGLSQQQLGERLSRPQSTIARWENGDQEPSYRAVVGVMKACGAQHGLQLFTYDASDVRMALSQLEHTPLERLRVAGAARAHLTSALHAIAECPLRLLVAGEAAAMLHGSPLSSHDELFDVVCHPADRTRATRELADHPVRFVDQPAGTRGYRDLNAAAVDLSIDAGGSVRLVSILDLLRIALTDRIDPAAGRKAIALDGALRAQRTDTAPAIPLTDEQARDRIAQWLTTQQ